jgi:hypothetical protein
MQCSSQFGPLGIFKYVFMQNLFRSLIIWQKTLPRTPAICELELSYCNEMLLKELPTGMQKIKIEGFNALESLPEGMIRLQRWSSRVLSFSLSLSKIDWFAF